MLNLSEFSHNHPPSGANLLVTIYQTWIFGDNWQRIVDRDIKWFYFVASPQKQGKPQTEYYAKKLGLLRKALEDQFAVEITDQKINDAILLHNEIRALQRKIYDLRRSTDVSLSGTDVLSIMVASTCMPKEVYKNLLIELIESLTPSVTKSSKKRLMVVGCDHDDVNLFKLIESQGADIVTDMLWYGYRSILKDVKVDGDPIYALADYEMNIRPQDPRTVDLCYERYAQIKSIGEEFKVDGYIHLKIPMCDMFAFDQDDFMTYCSNNDLPILKMDVEYRITGEGQLKTRVQAFVETL